MGYRKHYGVDGILGRFDNKYGKEVDMHYPKGYVGCDKIGRPLYIEQSGNINANELLKIVDEEYIHQALIFSYEKIVKHIFYSCSHHFQKQIFHNVTILDMTNFSIKKQFGKNIRAMLKFSSKIMQDNYPEQLGRMFVINITMLFKQVWNVVKAFLDEKTRQKFRLVYPSKVKTTLIEFIDEE